MSKQTILTGLRANNQLTLGNYFGGMLPIVDMAKSSVDEYQINMFIPDLHSFTTDIDHTMLFDQVLQNAKLFLAAGLPQHDNILMYRQSFVPAHGELTWILDCFTGIGEMNRMTQFKDKSASLSDDRLSMGLYNYPVLMASDILLYNAEYVPVGDDQTQHLEFTRDIAQRFNAKFGEIFTVPKPVDEQHKFFGQDQGLRIKDLQNPNKKMSKSAVSDKGVLFLTDPIDIAKQKIMSATTDSKAEIKFDKTNQPGISNLIEILSLTTKTPIDELSAKYQGQSNYGDFKSEVAVAVCEFLTDFQDRYSLIDDSYVLEILEKSETVANQTANNTLLNVQKAIGLRQVT